MALIASSARAAWPCSARYARAAWCCSASSTRAAWRCSASCVRWVELQLHAASPPLPPRSPAAGATTPLLTTPRAPPPHLRPRLAALQIPLSTAGAVEAQLPYLTEHLAFRAARARLPRQPVRLMSSITHGGPFELYNTLFNDSAQAYGGTILNLPQSYFNDVRRRAARDATPGATLPAAGLATPASQRHPPAPTTLCGLSGHPAALHPPTTTFHHPTPAPPLTRRPASSRSVAPTARISARCPTTTATSRTRCARRCRQATWTAPRTSRSTRCR